MRARVLLVLGYKSYKTGLLLMWVYTLRDTSEKSSSAAGGTNSNGRKQLAKQRKGCNKKGKIYIYILV